MNVRSISLNTLLQDLLKADSADDVLIRGITQNSHSVQPGDLFIALAGQQTHGMQYHQDARQRGAAALLAEPGGDWPEAKLRELAKHYAIPLLIQPSLRELAARIAARFYDKPAQHLRLIGITGTNGKTSISHYLAQALNATHQTGVIGTLGNGALNDLQTTQHTTPDAISLQAELARQVTLGIQTVAMETSSHALDQGRVAALPFHTAVFSNLSRDHQDYHGDMAAYGAAKAKLFHMPGLRYAVINTDDPFGRQLSEQINAQITLVTCGAQTNGAHHICPGQIEVRPSGLRIPFHSSWGDGLINSRLIGRFNAENLLLTLGVLLAWEMPLPQAIQALETIQPVAGRMSLLNHADQPNVLIDFAHTPDALQKALQSAREHATGQVICVFGCGGERDQGKRPLMGNIAETLADHIWLTDDNPRQEDAGQILEQILAGMRQPAKVQIERNRARAIQQAIHSAGPDDWILIAGKGHENIQQIGANKKPFSDLAQAQQALAESKPGEAA